MPPAPSLLPSTPEPARCALLAEHSSREEHSSPMEECPGSGAVPQTGLTGLQLPNHRAQGLWSASQFECGPATISGTGTRSVFGVLFYLVRAPARVPALWDWCQAFNSPRVEAPRPGGHFCSRCSAPWAPGSLDVPAAEHTFLLGSLQRFVPPQQPPKAGSSLPGSRQGSWTMRGFSSSSQASCLPLPRTRWLQPQNSAL